MNLTAAFHKCAHNSHNGLNVYRRVAKILSLLQEDFVSFQNTYSRPPLVDTRALLSETHEVNFTLKVGFSEFRVALGFYIYCYDFSTSILIFPICYERKNGRCADE
jgi:hypothetical protein